MPRSRIKLPISARSLSVAALALVLVGAVSCSSVWDEVTSYIEDDDANDRTLSQTGDSEDFPKLSEVPDTPRPASSPEDLDRLAEGLLADRDEARYTSETLRSRYAEDAGEAAETRMADATPSTTPRPIQQSAQQASELSDQRRAAASQSSSSGPTGGLADERRVGGVEPASEAVLQERRIFDERDRMIAGTGEAGGYGDPQSGALADSRRVDGGQAARETVSGETIALRESRVASLDQPAAASGVMPLSTFRDLFNARFDSSGRSPYRDGEMQQQAAQVAGDSLAMDRVLSPGSEEMVRAQMELTPPAPLPAKMDGGPRQAVISFQAASIPFAVGSAALNSSDRAALKQIVKLHEKFGGVVRVIGHASRRTRDMESGSHQWVNFQLSLDRATAVSLELSRLGVPAESVMVMALADNEPLTHEYMPLGEAENRRADIYIEY
jgi:flagellar motor protein MotB